jgi:DNA-binding phage protein
MTVKSVDYHSSLIERLKNPAYAAAFLNAILEEVEPESDLLKSALLNIAEALGDRMESQDLKTHQVRLDGLLAKPNSLSMADLMDWLEPFGLRLLVIANDGTQERDTAISEAS